MRAVAFALYILSCNGHGKRVKQDVHTEYHGASQQESGSEPLSLSLVQLALWPSRGRVNRWKPLVRLGHLISQPTVGFQLPVAARGLHARANRLPIRPQTVPWPATSTRTLGRSQSLPMDRFYRGRASVLRMQQGGESDGLLQFNLDKLIFSRYVGEITYTIVDSYERGAQNFGEERKGQSGTDFPGFGTPRFQKAGLVRQRVFTGDRDDTYMRTEGEDTRVLIREFAAAAAADSEEGQKEIMEIAAREINVLLALSEVADWARAPFTKLLGELTLAMRMMETAQAADPLGFEQDKAWTDALGTEPPRPRARWLVYEYDGLKSAASFSVPTELRVSRALRGRRRGLDMPRAPRRVSWDQAAQFVVKGIIRQTLQALAFLHNAGYAHRSLSPENLILSAPMQDKGEAVNSCDPSALVLKLQNFAFASRLTDDSPERRESAERWKINHESIVERVALSVAEDLHAVGYVFLTVLLGALAEPKSGEDPAGPLAMRSLQVLERQIEDVYQGDVSGKFRDSVASEPAWERVTEFMDRRRGWDFLETLLRAREAAASTGDSFSYLTAGQMLNHPFLN